MRVQARFRLDQVNRARNYYKAPGEEQAQAVEAAHVVMNAVQGEPFGNATPSGRIDMSVVNPAAAQMFFDASIGQEFDFFISPVEQ